MSRPLVVVLAGGRGRRLGGGKPGLALAGRPLIAWPLAAAAAAELDAVVAAKRATPLPPLAVGVWEEPDAPVHPLLGIVTALERAGARDVIAVGCDMPFVTADALRALAAAATPAAATEGGTEGTGGDPAPLLARYGPEALPALRDALAREAPLRRTLAALRPALVAVDARCLRNVNTREELAAAEREMARGLGGNASVR